MKWLKRFWWLIILGFIFGGGWMWRVQSQAKEAEKKSHIVKKIDITEQISLSGEVSALEEVDLRFQTSGTLAWVGVSEGDLVKKYQTLASLDKRELQNSFSQYMNDYLKERLDFDQAEMDNKDWQTRGMTNEARDAIKRSLQKGQYDLNNSVLAVEAKNLAMKYANLTAPFDGMVTNIDIPYAGTNITPATATIHIVNPASLYFAVTADQTEVTRFKVGQNAKLILESFPEIEIDSVIDKISFVPKSGASGTVYEMKMSFDASLIGADNIKIGMTGDADFVLRTLKQVVAIPESYIKKEDGRSYVKTGSADNNSRKDVKIGASIEGMVEITEGLNEGDVIYN